MQEAQTPLWVWVFISVAMVPAIGAVALLLFAELVRKRPYGRLKQGDLSIDVWGGDWYRAPRADAIVVPVAPDLQMYSPVAKWVRDATAFEVQNQANRVAPLSAGDAFVGTGGKYRFNMAALAVVMDEQKRVTGEWVASAIAQAIRKCAEQGAQSVVIPDMTEDLLRHPETISKEQRRQTCEVVAPAVIQGILRAGSALDHALLWVWRTENREIYLREIQRMGGEVESNPKGLSAAPA